MGTVYGWTPPAQTLAQPRPSPSPARPATAPGLCFSRAHAVPAGRVAGCRIAEKLSGTQRECMRAGRPRSRVGPGLCFSRAHAVPAGRVAGRGIAGKLSGTQRECMRAGHPRSRVGLLPTFLLLEVAGAGLPGRSPASAPPPSRFVDCSFFACFSQQSQDEFTQNVNCRRTGGQPVAADFETGRQCFSPKFPLFYP